MKSAFVSALVSVFTFSGMGFAQEGTPETPDDTSNTPESDATRLTQRYVVVDGALYLDDGQNRRALDVAAPVVTATAHAGKLYVTHGTPYVSVYETQTPDAPVLVDTLAAGHGVVSNVEVLGDDVWVVLVAKQAVPVRELGSFHSRHSGTAGAGATPPGVPAVPPDSPTAAPAGGDAPSANTDAAAPANQFTLSVVEPGVIQLAAGAQSQVRIGDKFAIYRETAVDNTGGTFRGEELVAVAEVVAVTGDSALAELSRAAVVTNTDVARPLRDDQTESNIYPVRVPHVGEVGGTLRPIVNAGSPLGFGALADVHASYWGKGYFFSLMVQPLGLGWTDEGNIISTSALLEGGYDARAFSVGLGVGISAINGDTDVMLWDSYDSAAPGSNEDPRVIERQETHQAFTLSQWARLGARDGLNLSVRNFLLLHKQSGNDDRGFIYGGTMGKLTIPLDRRNDLFLEGGGGVMGYWLVGAGVGTWLVGNGSPGSWKLSIAAGAAGIWGTKEVTVSSSQYSWTEQYDVEVAGPMVSFGVTRRFAL